MPALFLIFFISYLLIFVGPSALMEEFQAGTQSLSEGIKSYSQAINEIGVVVKMKELK